MATVADVVRRQEVSVGRVYQRAFSTIGRNPLVMIAMALLFGGLPGATVNYFTIQLPTEIMVLTFGSLVLPGFVALIALQWFFGVLIGVVAQAALTRPVIAQSDGRKASLWESLVAVLPALLSLIPLGALFGLGVVIGATLLLVPALVLYVLWAVAASAAVEEREGMFLAITRSQELSEGARWKVTGIMMVLVVVSMALGVLIGFALRLLQLGQLSPALIAVWVLVGTVINLLWGSVQASLYVELRDWKDGPAANHYEQVFG